MSTDRRPATAAPADRRCRQGRGRLRRALTAIVAGLFALQLVGWPAAPGASIERVGAQGTGVGAGPTGTDPAEADDPADTDAEDPASAQLQLEEQTAWTRAGEDFAARFRLPTGHGGAFVSARLHEAVEDRGDIATTAQRDGLGRSLIRLPDLEVAAGAPTVVVRFAVGPAADRVALEPGVYPLVVEASTENGESPEPVVTHVVVVGADQVGRRPLAVVTRIDQRFRWAPEGRLELEGGPGALADQLAPLAAHPSIVHTLIPTPGTVAALTDTVEGNRSRQVLNELADRGQVVNGPFARLPAGAWTAARLDYSLVEQFAAGEVALTAALGSPSGRTWLVSPTDDLTLLRWLSARGVGTFLVPVSESPDGAEAEAEAEADTDTDETADDADPPRTPFRLAGLDRPHVGLAIESVTAPSVEAGDGPEVGPVALAHRLLAELSVAAVAEGAEGAAAPQSPAVLLIDDLGPEARPLVETLLAALEQPGPLRTMAADGLGQLVGMSTTDDRPTWDLPEPVRLDLGSLPVQLAEAQREIESFVATVGALDPAVTSLQRAVLTLGAENLTSDDRSAIMADLGEVVRGQLATVALDRDQPVTVTAHRADVPVAVHNRGTRALDVVLRVESSDLDVVGPAARPLRLQPGATADVAIPVRVNRSGDFRVNVEVSSPDGHLMLASRTLTVRSTAISGAGVVLSVGALAFLFLWWGRHVRRTRRARRPVAVSAPVEPRRVEEPVP